MTDNAHPDQIKNRNGICLISPSPSDRINESTAIRINDLILLLQPLAKNIFLIINKNISGETITQETVKFVAHASCPDARAPFQAIIWGELRAQFQIIIGLFKLPRQVRILIWRGRSSTFILPIILARILNKRSLLFVESQGFQLIGKVHKNPIKGFLLSHCYKLIDTTTRCSSDKMLVFVPSLLKQLLAKNQSSKIFPYPVIDRFVRADFEVSRPFHERQPLVGYIGRMSQEKGILNLAKAILLVSDQTQDVQFLLGGDGPLLPQVKQELSPLIAQNRVMLPGWISYAELPQYLNRIKLLVVPSYYEALPNIILEAMACGTPVLASSVGAIPDIIIDSQNGFIMKDNSPECIAANILRALAYQNLEDISHNGQILVSQDYSYHAASEKWRQIINNLR
jgi:glycosyltransferase involved in cell wall biosynthesis